MLLAWCSSKTFPVTAPWILMLLILLLSLMHSGKAHLLGKDIGGDSMSGLADFPFFIATISFTITSHRVGEQWLSPYRNRKQSQGTALMPFSAPASVDVTTNSIKELDDGWNDRHYKWAMSGGSTLFPFLSSTVIPPPPPKSVVKCWWTFKQSL